MLKIRIIILILYFILIYIGFFCGILFSVVCVNYFLFNNIFGYYVLGFLASDIVFIFGYVVFILYSGFMIL